MKITRKKGPKQEDLELCRPSVYRNLVDGMKQTLATLDKMQVQFRTQESEYYANIINNFEFEGKNEDLKIPEEVIEGIRYFWYRTPLQQGFDALVRVSYVLESAPL